MEVCGIMKAISTSFFLEAKNCFVRDFLMVFISSLSMFFATFIDFPFQAENSEASDLASTLSLVVITWCLFLAIFCRSVTRDLDDREYFSQHPLYYRYHYIGKCIYIFLVLGIVSVMEFFILLLHALHYSSSLVALELADLVNNLWMNLCQSLFIAGVILFVSLFRPFHYALLIVIVSAVYFSFQTWPVLEPINAVFLFYSLNALPYLTSASFFCFSGMLIFERKMKLAPKTAKPFFALKARWLKKLRISLWAPTVCTFLVAGTALYVTINQNEGDDELSAWSEAVIDFKRSVRKIKNQQSAQTVYFSYQFNSNNVQIFEVLAESSDSEWKKLHEEFFITFEEGRSVIDVFIKASQKHQLGSTRGSYVVINAAAISTAVEKKRAKLQRVLRHELAHVLINEISRYKFIANTEILGGFLHEGLATLVEHHWIPNDEVLIAEAALHYQVFDKTFYELLPQLVHYKEYDYMLNYSLGYVFWGEFVKIYGQQKVRDFLRQLGKDDVDDMHYERIWFLFHKASLANIDLYKVFHASKKTLRSAYEQLDSRYKTDTAKLADFKVTRMNEKEILIPYQFARPELIYCVFRQKNSLMTVAVRLQEKDYSGRKGGLCKITEGNQDEVQLSIHFSNGLNFYSRWIGIPDALEKDI